MEEGGQVFLVEQFEKEITHHIHRGLEGIQVPLSAPKDELCPAGLVNALCGVAEVANRDPARHRSQKSLISCLLEDSRQA